MSCGTVARVCGRFVAANTPDQIAQYFGAEPPELALPGNYNVAPTNDIYAVVAGAEGTPKVDVFHWGLVPLWAKDRKIASKMINARAETLAEKSAFKNAFRKYRCIIPMDGFYEWKAGTATGALDTKGKPVKQPMFIHRVDGEPLAVAGLWSAWRDREAGPDAPWLHTCTVITTSANETMAPVHDRMPVLLPASEWQHWLDPSNQDLDDLSTLLIPAPNTLLTMHPVSTDVNRVANKGSELIAPIDPTASETA
jgi:putative SOS response-associated peptidase YedK